MAAKKAISYLKRYAIALLVSAAALVLRFLFPQPGLEPALLMATVLAWGATSVYGALRPASEEQPKRSDDVSDAKELPTRQQIMKLVGDVNTLVEEELQVLRESLEQIEGLASDAVKTLNKSFNGLNEQVQAQSRLVHSTIGSMMERSEEKDAKHVSIYEFIEEFGEVIEYFIDLTEEIRRQRRDIIDHFDEMADHMSTLFAEVEAREARDSEIREQGEMARRYLTDARRSVGEMDAGERDMNLAVMAKDRVDIARAQLKEMNAYIAENLDVLSGEINTGVGMAVRSLQFEDIVSQVVNNATIRLDRMGALITKLKGRVGRLKVVEAEDGLRHMHVVREIQGDVTTFAEESHRTRSKPVAQASVSEGTVELF